MSDALLDGMSIPLEDAYQHAARILGAAKFPVVAGLGADIAGARAAILLAERLRGAFDHLASRDAFADLDVVRSSGMFVTSPNEARVRADLFVLIGPGLSSYWPEIFDRLALNKPPRLGGQTSRRVLWVGPKRNEAKLDGVEVETIAATPDELPGVVAALRARLGGRPVALSAAATKKIDQAVETMKAAHFGVAVWAAAGLDALTVEMLQGLITDLNATTRFTGVPIGARAGASGVIQVSGWTTGFPPRTGFGRGYPEHDPWRFEAKRLVESGEADAALWISAYDGEPPPWSRADIPLITLAPANAKASAKRGLFIEVGRPGEDHDCVELARETGSLVLRPAKAPSALPSVAESIAAISARFPEDAPC
jgi:formylmethanofuran dehydrogenase subunit B